MGTPACPQAGRLDQWPPGLRGSSQSEACLKGACAACSPATVLVITPSHTLPEGTSANLTCSVRREAGGGPANFSWFRNGALWTQGPLETVTLLPVARTDAALYACRVLSEAGAQLSAPVVLSVLCASWARATLALGGLVWEEPGWVGFGETRTWLGLGKGGPGLCVEGAVGHNVAAGMW